MNIAIILKSHGKSITEERKEIFSFLETKHIFSAQEVQEQFPALGRASVFRTIRLFLEIGIIRRLNIGERGESYELNDTSHHHEHMKCTLCQSIMSFDSHSICRKIFEEAKKQGFAIQEHSLSILGKCSKCQII
jgi:Fur family ferric uptake transcriptional regulator